MKNIITIDQVEEAFGVKFNKSDRKKLEETMPKGSVPETHILFPYYPLSINELRKKAEELRPDETIFYSQAWYDDEQFAKDKLPAGWLCVRREAFPGSENKTFQEQQKLIPRGEYFSTAQEGIYLMVLWFLLTGERLFRNTWVRTSTKTSGGHLVAFGYFRAGGADVNGWRPGSADSGLRSLFSRSLENLDTDCLSLDLSKPIRLALGGEEYEINIKKV